MRHPSTRLSRAWNRSWESARVKALLQGYAVYRQRALPGGRCKTFAHVQQVSRLIFRRGLVLAPGSWDGAFLANWVNFPW